jgi:type I restriction enzyme S subunit
MVRRWKEVELLSLSDGGMQNGVFYEVSRKGRGIPLINVSDLYKTTPINSNNLELFDATDDEINRFAINDGDLFFTRSSVVPSGIAHCNWYQKTQKGKFVVFDSHVIRFKTDVTKVVPMYLYLQCVSAKVRNFFIANAKTATMTTIDQTILGKCPIPLPPLPEQRAIAAVLSDTDELITALKKLIAKKRAIKQGAMQELLTGKRRLPGFNGEWVEEKLGEVADVYDNFRIPVAESQRKKGQTPYTHDGEFVLLAEDGASDILNYPVNYVLGKVWVNNHAHVIQGIVDIANTKYLFYSLKTIDFISVLVGGTRAKLNGSALKKIIITMPQNLSEQTAIATILSDMDAEIDTLSAKLNKLKHIKQGMMSALLTGRIRLVEQESVIEYPIQIDNSERLKKVAEPKSEYNSDRSETRNKRTKNG